MAGYWIVRSSRIENQAAFDEYAGRWAPIAEKYGARFIAGREGAHETREGEDFARVLLVEFPSYEQARAAYDDPGVPGRPALRARSLRPPGTPSSSSPAEARHSCMPVPPGSGGQAKRTQTPSSCTASADRHGREDGTDRSRYVGLTSVTRGRLPMSMPVHSAGEQADPAGPAGIANRSSLDSRRLDFEAIPIIDLGPMFGSERAAMEDCASALRRACTEVGFFYIANHGVEERTIRALVDQTRRFFELPEEVKLAYDLARTHRHRGYVPFEALSADPGAEPDVQEAYEVGLELPADDPLHLAGNPLYGPNVWPEGPPGFAEEVYAYFEEVRGLGHLLLRAFAIALGLPDEFFEAHVTRPMTQLRLIHYPPSEHEVRNTQALGVGGPYRLRVLHHPLAGRPGPAGAEHFRRMDRGAAHSPAPSW